MCLATIVTLVASFIDRSSATIAAVAKAKQRQTRSKTEAVYVKGKISRNSRQSAAAPPFHPSNLLLRVGNTKLYLVAFVSQRKGS